MDKKDGEKLEVEIELDNRKESYNELDELYLRVREKLDISERSLKEARTAHQELRNDIDRGGR